MLINIPYGANILLKLHYYIYERVESHKLLHKLGMPVKHDFSLFQVGFTEGSLLHRLTILLKWKYWVQF